MLHRAIAIATALVGLPLLLAQDLVAVVDLLSAVVSMAVIALYISYGLPILARLKVRFRGMRDEVGPWNLGRFSTLNSLVAVAWISFIMVVFVLPPNLAAGKGMAILVAGLAVLWFGYVGRHFRGPKVHFFDREDS